MAKVNACFLCWSRYQQNGHATKDQQSLFLLSAQIDEILIHSNEMTPHNSRERLSNGHSIEPVTRRKKPTVPLRIHVRYDNVRHWS